MSVKVDRLELYNFKSYNGRVVVGPFQNFSCIVGPNGAGKSNLMDSLSFVLGSSATTLRGKKPTDFINRAARKQEASVTLVLRQPNNTEVALTRSIDAKGNITVAVDKHTVTDKEFTAVLKKFRIGHRVASFLVFQHEVDAVAQKKAKELTEMLESISGSGELKEEYEAKKRALQDANEKLTAASMEKRGAVYEMNQLKLHKKEAERFEEVNRRLAAERRDLALAELFHIEVNINKQKKELETLNEEVKKLKATTMSEEDVRNTKKAYGEKHKEYLEILKKSREANQAAREKAAMLERIKAAVEHNQKKLEAEKKDLSTATEATTTRSKELQRLDEQLKVQEQLLAAFEAACAKEDADAAKQGKLTVDQLKEYKQLRRDADCETITLRQELETLRRKKESLTEGMKQVTSNVESRDELRANVLDVVKRNEARVAEITTRIADAKKNVADLEAKAEQSRAELHRLQARVRERDEEFKRVVDQLHELRHLKEDTKQGQRAGETLKALKAMHPGIHGRLVDLCNIPVAKYRNAVTVAMGKNLEAIVVDTADTALACVRYLKEQRIAAMTFIPLATAQGNAVDDRLRSFGGTCRPIVDVIKFDPSIEPAIRFSVGQTLVCDAMDEARQIAYNQPGGVRHKVVTVDGTVLLKNGSIQGGLSTVQSRARKWDEKAYDDLKNARDRLIREGAGAADAEEARVQIEAQDTQSRLASAQSRVKQLEIDASMLTKKNEALLAEHKEAEKTIAALRQRRDEYAAKVAKVEAEMDEVQKKVSAIESRVFGDFQKRVGIPNVAELEQKETRKERERAERRQQLTVVIHKLKTTIETQSKKYGDKNQVDADAAVKKTLAELKGCQSDYEKYKAVVASATSAQEAIQAKVAAAKAELDALESTIRNRTRDSDAELQKLEAARKSVTTLQASCNALRQQRASLFQRCRMEEVDLPTVSPDTLGGKRGRDQADNTRRKTRDDEAVDDYMRVSEAFTSFTESETTATRRSGGGNSAAAAAALAGAQKETSLCIDFSSLADALRFGDTQHHGFLEFKVKAEAFIDQLERELETIAPNLKATARFSSSEQKLGSSATQLEEARERARKALIDFTKVKELRTARFMDTFEKIVVSVDQVYRELTLGTRAQDVHGSAYLSLEDAEEPYNGGTKYHATPPMKRFMTIELLSGGERTMAALALLFAIHSISPAPFFVLDEVDAALDSANVSKLAHYLRTHSDRCQFLVVSLKDQLYHVADSLLGVYKDRHRESSGTLTLDLKQFPNDGE